MGAQGIQQENYNPNTVPEPQSASNYGAYSEYANGPSSEFHMNFSLAPQSQYGPMYSAPLKTDLSNQTHAMSCYPRPLSTRLSFDGKRGQYHESQYLNGVQIAEKYFVTQELKPIFKVSHGQLNGKFARYSAKKNYIAQNFGKIDVEAIKDPSLVKRGRKNKQNLKITEDAQPQACKPQHNMVLNKSRTTCAQPESN